MVSDKVRLLPKNACPNCQHREFIIRDMCVNTFSTDRDGIVSKFLDEERQIAGVCTHCGKQYDMYPAYDTYIPLTPIRKMLKEYQPEVLDKTNNNDWTYLVNPMNNADNLKY